MPIGTYTPTSDFSIFFHFRCILLQISHKKCFFISISILGRSGVKLLNTLTFGSYNKEISTSLMGEIPTHINRSCQNYRN